MKPTKELIKTLIEGRTELDRIYVRTEATSEDEALRLRALFDRTQELSRKIDALIDAEIRATLVDMKHWTEELTPVIARLKAVAANIEGTIVAADLVDKVLKIVLTIVALIIAV